MGKTDWGTKSYYRPVSWQKPLQNAPPLSGTLPRLADAGSPSCWVLCSAAHLHTALSDPVDCSPPGSTVEGIYQTRILEWVAISCSGDFLLTQELNLLLRAFCPGWELNPGLPHGHTRILPLNYTKTPTVPHLHFWPIGWQDLEEHSARIWVFSPSLQGKGQTHRHGRFQGKADTGWASCGGRKQGHAGDGERERYPIMAHSMNSASF